MTNRYIFQIIARTGSFAQAARELGLARSTVLRRLDALEEELETSLTQRTPRGILLTEAGRQYNESLTPILQELERVEQRVKELDGAPRGTLHILLPMLGSDQFLAESTAEYQAAFPDVILRLTLGGTRRNLPIGGFDVAMQIGLGDNQGLISKLLFRDAIGLFASPSYLERRGTPMSLSDLPQHDGVHMLDGDNAPIPWLRAEGDPIPMPRAKAIVNSMGLAQSLAVRGVGIVLLSASYAHENVQGGRLVNLFPDVHMSEPVYLLYPPNPSQTARSYIEFTNQWSQSNLPLTLPPQLS